MASASSSTDTSMDVGPTTTDYIADPVVLETNIDDEQVQQEALLRAWVELYPHSVEATLANQSDLLEFGNTHCLFFAAVLWNHSVKVELDRFSLPIFSEMVAGGGAGADAVEITTQPAPTGGDVPIIRVWDTVGVLYVAPSSLPSEVHIGVAILPDFRKRGLGRRACEIALGWAIDTLQMHRVQARILPSPHQHRARSLFAALGLAHEGVHRRAVLGPHGEWADVTHMGVLDTDWHIRARTRGARRSLWDELLERHQREVEEMLRSEEARERAGRRSSSVETIRVAPDPNPVPEWQERGRAVCTPWPPSEASTSSRASSSAPEEYSDIEKMGEADPLMRYRGDSPQPSGSEAGDARLSSDPRWQQFFASLATAEAPQSPEGEPVPRSPSSASSSSFASVGSFPDGIRGRRGFSDDDDDWVSLGSASSEGSPGRH